jgi:tetratricopeptide (TPR) repeat protein
LSKRQVVEQWPASLLFLTAAREIATPFCGKINSSAREKSRKHLPMSRPRLIALLLALVTLAVYLPVRTHSFVNYDDPDYVTENPFVKNGLTLPDIKWAFTAFHAGNWHPLTWLSHMADCELFKLNPGGHHLVNVLFHAANAVLLFTLLLRLTEKICPSAMVAALFAWHPLHVESVAWIAERKDVLSTLFALLTLLSYAKFTKEKCRRSFWFAFLFFALGLMSKPMLVTLPFVMLLLDFWPLNRFLDFKFQMPMATLLMLEKWPFFLLTMISCIVTFLAQRSGDAVVSLAKVSLSYRLENAPVAIARYLLKMIWPADLAIIYPMPDRISAIAVAASVLVLIFISAAAWLTRQRSPYLLSGWLWFLGTLIPVIGLVQVGGAALADRYTYFPAIGIFIAAVFGFCQAAQRFHFPKIIFPAATVLILGACLFLTEKQLSYWRDSESLFRHALAVTKNNDIALADLGVALDAQGRLDEALGYYRQAAQLEAGRYQIHNNIATILDKMGKPAEALAEYREAVRLKPDLAFLHNGLGGELATLGQSDAALKEFAEAARLDPNYAWPHVETAKLFFQQGRDAEAVNELRAALRIEPDNFQILATTAHYVAANENAAARDGQSALVLATKANLLTGGNQPMIFDILGMAFAATGDFTHAQACAQNALDLANAAQMKNLEPLKARLALYQNHQPWRESFLAPNAPEKK